MVAHETTSTYSSEELTLACSALAFFPPVEQGGGSTRMQMHGYQQHCCFCSVWALEDGSSAEIHPPVNRPVCFPPLWWVANHSTDAQKPGSWKFFRHLWKLMSLQLKMANDLSAAQSHAGSSPTGLFCCKVRIGLSVKCTQREGGDEPCKLFTPGFDCSCSSTKVRAMWGLLLCIPAWRTEVT